MGYIESAPFFCSTTEMVADIANNSWAANIDALLQPNPVPISPSLPHTNLHIAHPLDHIADTPPLQSDDAAMGIPSDLHETQLRTLCSHLAPGNIHNLLVYIYVYADDFIALAQGPKAVWACLQCHLFRCIDLVFQPNNVNGTYRQESNSVKKLHHGDAFWTTHKK
eukprot:392302-Ditylum_brightwellii.AAC.1